MTDKKKLTIGMATFDDYDGVYFTIKAIRLYHPEILKDIEFLILDNNPDGTHSHAIKMLLRREVPEKHRYLPIRDKVTSFTKYRVFEFAETPYVICMDSHVLFEKGSLKKLLNYYDKNPTTKDLIQGPLILGEECLTHWSDEWWKGQRGHWLTDERGVDPKGKPFEITTQGMGMLSCRKDAFPEINSSFRGFGGEEGYIQEKVRRNGGKVLCFPFLRWHHRFDNEKPTAITYPRCINDRIRNNFITHLELGWDVMPIFKHFAEDFGVNDISKIYVDTVAELREQGRDDIKINKIKLSYMENVCRVKNKVNSVKTAMKNSQKPQRKKKRLPKNNNSEKK